MRICELTIQKRAARRISDLSAVDISNIGASIVDMPNSPGEMGIFPYTRNKKKIQQKAWTLLAKGRRKGGKRPYIMYLEPDSNLPLMYN